jgi:hypothetical protein
LAAEEQHEKNTRSEASDEIRELPLKRWRDGQNVNVGPAGCSDSSVDGLDAARQRPRIPHADYTTPLSPCKWTPHKKKTDSVGFVLWISSRNRG